MAPNGDFDRFEQDGGELQRAAEEAGVMGAADGGAKVNWMHSGLEEYRHVWSSIMSSLQLTELY